MNTILFFDWFVFSFSRLHFMTQILLERDDTLLASSVIFTLHYKNQEFITDSTADSDFNLLDEQVKNVLMRALFHTPNVIIVTNAEVSVLKLIFLH